MKYEWRKSEKNLYLPSDKPELVRVPDFNFYTIEGKGNPNDAQFAEYIGVLYSLSYAVKMSPKKGMAPKGYYDYTVFPLEGVWDLAEEARNNYAEAFDKNDLIFTLMIRQPDFVDHSFALQVLEHVQKNKPNDLLGKVRFEKISEGACIQMLHKGSYDNEPASFGRMQEFADQLKLRRKYKTHREIYLSDARKVPAEQLKTVLRFQVEKLSV